MDPGTELQFGVDGAFHDVNLATFQINRMKRYGNSVALVDPRTDRFYTYADVIDRIQRLAAGLRDLGMRKGDVLCILTYNHIDYHVIWYAVSMLGGTLQTAAPSYNDEELLRRFKECGTKFLVTTSDQTVRVQTMLHNAKLTEASISKPNILTRIIVYGGDATGLVSFESLLSRGRLLSAIKVEPVRDVTILLSSSGTTGLPKHVMLSHRNIVANIPQLQEALQMYPGMVTILSLAIFHHYGIHSVMNTALYSGVKVVVMERYDLDMLLALVQKHKAEVLHLVPPMVLNIVKCPHLYRYDLSSVKHVASAAAPFGIELERAVKRVLGLKTMCQAYGLTETGMSTGHGVKVYKEGSVGVAPRGVKLKIADVETGRPLPANQTGEILVAGPQVTIGYLNKPEYSKTCFDHEGYFRTGDLGHVDSEGFLFYEDRLKELIKYKATQVAPAFLEDVLKKHPEIADAAVVGVPDEEAGELPKAFVVRQPESPVTEADIHDYMKEHVASYMRLRGGVEFTNAIPKTPSGKILRRLLQQQTKKAKL